MRFAVLAAACAVLFAVPALADDSLSAEANQAFLAANAVHEGVTVRPSGLQYRVLKSGLGRSAHAGLDVEVYYKGWLINGHVFDGTEPGFPADFTVGNVIAGWNEALTLMKEGDKWQLVIPPNLAYGERGAGDVIPPNQTLVFDVELVKVSNPQPIQTFKDKE